jgi:3-oxoacyl-[acyl-carrier-protein] synthase II
MLSDPVVVTGIGTIIPSGFDREALIGSLFSAERVPAQLRIPEFELEKYLPGGRAFRRVSRATKFALAAMGMAVADAGLAADQLGGDAAGLIVTITHGGAPYSVEFHRQMLLEGPAAASPMYFSESVPNAPAGNGAIALNVRGPVHTLVGEEPVGVQAIDLAARLLRTRQIVRCIVAGTEEWCDVIAHAYGQIEAARQGARPERTQEVIPLTEGAAALVLELKSGAEARGARPHVELAGWKSARSRNGDLGKAISGLVKEACGAGHSPADVDHVLLPTGRFRAAAQEGCLAVCGKDPSPIFLDVARRSGNPVGASNLLQMATSAALLSAGKVNGPGLVVATGMLGNASAAILSRNDRVRA